MHAPGPVDNRQPQAPFALTTVGQMSAASSSVPPAEAAATAGATAQPPAEGAGTGAAEQPPTEGAGAGATEQPPVAEPETEPVSRLFGSLMPMPPPTTIGEQFPVSFSFKLAVKTREVNFETHAELDNTFLGAWPAKRPRTT